jgi:alkylhydroperoxidase family enzyme
MTFQIFTPQTAPPGARSLLERMKDAGGFIPELAGVFAGAPALLEAYEAVKACTEKCSLSEEEREVVLRAAAHEDNCARGVLRPVSGQDVDEEVLAAADTGRPLADSRLEALRQYTIGVMWHHGRPSDEAKDHFIAAGYGPQQALEIVLCISLVTMASYTASLAHKSLRAH